MTHKPIQPETREFMNDIAHAIDYALNGKKPPKWGFALLIYPFGDPGEDRMNYIGNGKREDVLVALKELVARWEGRLMETGGLQ
jgi:hypothetical protein